MTIKSAPYYWLDCDGCGRSSTDGGEFAAWADESQAFADAEGGDWLLIDDGPDYCPGCTKWCPDCESELIFKAADRCPGCVDGGAS